MFTYIVVIQLKLLFIAYRKYNIDCIHIQYVYMYILLSIHYVPEKKTKKNNFIKKKSEELNYLPTDGMLEMLKKDASVSFVVIKNNYVLTKV